MKDLSLFLLKNALGAKMRKRFKNMCHGDDSTSTVNQQKTERVSGSGCVGAISVVGSPCMQGAALMESEPTLEEMILQLELEDRAARRAKIVGDEYGEIRQRMSCVNSSDILRSARNALNQYPRFSLDGKDAMYRSSFRNVAPISCIKQGYSRRGFVNKREAERVMEFPGRFGGESVVWCRPGVVAKLMGLESIPIPIGRYGGGSRKRQDERMKGAARDEGGFAVGMERGRGKGYCVMKTVGGSGGAVEYAGERVGWPMSRFL